MPAKGIRIAHSTKRVRRPTRTKSRSASMCVILGKGKPFVTSAKTQHVPHMSQNRINRLVPATKVIQKMFDNWILLV